LHGFANKRAAPIVVLLVPDAKEVSPIVSAPEREVGTYYYITSFGDVPEGKYTLVFEPIK
jgi:hypothetical protein